MNRLPKIYPKLFALSPSAALRTGLLKGIYQINQRFLKENPDLFVTPAKVGVYPFGFMDSGLRRNDEIQEFFKVLVNYEIIWFLNYRTGW